MPIPNSTMKCNYKKGSQTFNFCGIVPRHYHKDERMERGVSSVMALARVNLGWKTKGKFQMGAVDVLQFAAMRIGAIALRKEDAAERKRTKKA